MVHCHGAASEELPDQADVRPADLREQETVRDQTAQKIVPSAGPGTDCLSLVQPRAPDDQGGWDQAVQIGEGGPPGTDCPEGVAGMDLQGYHGILAASSLAA